MQNIASPGTFTPIELPQQRGEKGIVNAMTVDVEDYFQVQAFFGAIDRQSWESKALRVERNVDLILALFERHSVVGTFFTLGWVAEKCPQVVKKIAAAGHEIGSHGYDHTRADSQNEKEFREDIKKTKSILEDLSGQQVHGYRAATFSIGLKNLWAFEVLESEGYIYSSSINPIPHDLYGMPDAPRFSFKPFPGAEIIEIPVTTTKFGKRNFPCGGGGYFRLLPYAAFRALVQRVNNVDAQPSMFYFHPWEVDPDQPRVGGISAKMRFRHYLNLNRMESRLDRLLGDFEWGRVIDAYSLKSTAA